jgi:hypothetical protein
VAGLGSRRSGRGDYSYDWIENLAGLDMHSADRIFPEFQDLAVGDSLALGARGPRLQAAVLEPPHSMVLSADDGNWVLTFALMSDANGSRLISRNRIRISGGSALTRAMYKYLIEPGSLVTEHKMLLSVSRSGPRNSPPEPSTARAPASSISTRAPGIGGTGTLARPVALPTTQ